MNVKDIGKSAVGRTAKNPVAWSVYKFCGRLSTQFGRIYGHARHTLETPKQDEKPLLQH